VARRAPLGHAGGVPTIRVTRPQHREPARALHLLRPRSCRGWYQAGRQPSAVSHRITAWPGPDCGGGRRAEQRNRKDHEHGGPEAAPAAVGCLPGFPHGLACCWYRAGPLPVADPAGEPLDGAGGGPLDAAASRGYRRRRPRREEYLVLAAVFARRAPTDRSVPEVRTPGPTSLYGTARNVIRGGTGYRAWLWGACRPGHARVCWCEDGQIAAPVWPGCRYSPM